MEAHDPAPAPQQAPSLRLVPGRDAAASGQRAWIAAFGALAFSGGHGVFLFTALTRLSKIPSRVELGGGVELVAIGWFLAAAPLALVMLALRGWFTRLPSRTAWGLSFTTLAVTLGATAFYLRAIALA